MSAPSVLVIDSNGEHAADCLSFLEDSGFSVTVARDLRAAEAALETRPEILILDAILNGEGTESLARSAANQGANVFGMSDVFVGDTNRDIAIGLHGCVDYWEKPVAADAALEWFRRVLGDRFPTPGTSTGGGPQVGEEAALRDGEPWGHRPTNVTPVGGEPVVEESTVSSTEGIEEEPEDLGATPLPSGESSYNATTRVATAEELAADLRVNEAALSAQESGSNTGDRGASFETPASQESVSIGIAAAAEREESLPDAPAKQVADDQDHVVFARSASQSGLPAAEVDVPPLFDASGLSANGSLGETTFAAVLAAQLRSGTTGVLRVERGGFSKELFLDGGDIVGLRSDAPEDALGAILLSDGLIRSDQAGAITRNLGEDALSVPETYVDANVIGVDDLPSLEALLIRRRAHDVFAWTEGEWSVSSERCPSSVRASESVSGGRLLHDGIMFGADTTTVREALSPQLRCPIAWMGAKPEDDLLSWQTAIVDRIDGTARTSTVMMGAPDRDEALRFIALLTIEGRIGFVP